MRPPPKLPPNLVSIRSKCGGAMTLVIDESASIGDVNFEQVKAAVKTS